MTSDFVTIPLTVHNAREARLQDAIRREFDETYVLYKSDVCKILYLQRIITDAKEMGLEAEFISQLEKDARA